MSIVTGYKTIINSVSRDLGYCFLPGNSGITTGFKMLDGGSYVDIGTKFAAGTTTGTTTITTGYKRPTDGKDLGELFASALPGLSFRGYPGTNSTFIWYINPSFTTALSFFSNTSFTRSGTVTTITNGYATNNDFLTLLGGAGQSATTNSAVSLRGYFKAAVTGRYSFVLGATDNAPNGAGATGNDDVCVFWFGTVGQTFENLLSTATLDNAKRKNNYNVAFTETVYTTPDLTAGSYYPMMLNWGNSSNATLFLGFIQSAAPVRSSAWLWDGTGYYFN